MSASLMIRSSPGPDGTKLADIAGEEITRSETAIPLRLRIPLPCHHVLKGSFALPQPGWLTGVR
jgi:hypothetical protein